MVAAFSLVSLVVASFATREHLVAIYWFIAISGLTWPWLAIGLALAGDALTRPRDRRIPDTAVTADAPAA